MLKFIYKKIVNSRFSGMAKIAYEVFLLSGYHLLTIIWPIKGERMPTKSESRLVAKNVTFIFKSFERQRMAKRLYRSIQKYYSGARVIIADDNRKPLKIDSKYAEIIQLPFNSGLSYGLNCTLERVTTPFTMRMDDDEILTLNTRIHIKVTHYCVL